MGRDPNEGQSRGTTRGGKGQYRYMLDRLEMPELEAIAVKARRKILYEAAKVVALRARLLAPDSGKKHKGKLRKTIRYRSLNAWQGAVYSKAPHAHLVHDGTKAHGISARTPETARANWRFYRNSTETVVNHPGARAQPFLTDARDQTIDLVEKVMRDGLEAAAAEVAAGGGA